VELIVKELVNQEKLQVDYEYWSAYSLAEAVANFQMQFDGWRDLKHQVLVEAIARMEITGRNDE
jgi:tryptophan 2,3-dioxygenase